MTAEFSAGTVVRTRSSRRDAVSAFFRHLPDALRTAGWQEYALLAVAAVTIVAIRGSAVFWATDDYTNFLSKWFAFLQQHGFAGLGQSFADYNMPYLYLLWIGTLTPLSDIAWIKSLSFASDLLLAAGALVLLQRLRIPRFTAGVAAVLVLLLPELVLNSALWGQADSLYSALIVWALAFAVRRRDVGMWVLFALALSFKLQAVFLLPAFALAFIAHRHRLRAPLIGAAAFLATWLPAVVAGRSIPSLLGIYSNQASQYHYLVLDAPSAYQWIPNTAYNQFVRTGTLFTLAVCAVLAALLLRHFRTHVLTDRALLIIAAAFGCLVPFLLPAMHERYFFTANVLLFLLAVLDRRYLLLALVAQLVAVLAYTHFLFGVQPVVPYGWLALVELGVVAALVWRLFVRRDPALLEPVRATTSADVPAGAAAP